MSTSASFALTCDPLPWTLPDAYPRHDPAPAELHKAMDGLAGRLDWPQLSWAGLTEGLLRVGVTDIPLGRLVEGHVDALRILGQAGVEPRPTARYGVWASRSAGTGIAAVVEGAGLRLNGTIRFASGAGILDRALVPVWLDPETHLLVDLAVDGCRWIAATGKPRRCGSATRTRSPWRTWSSTPPTWSVNRASTSVAPGSCPAGWASRPCGPGD